MSNEIIIFSAFMGFILLMLYVDLSLNNGKEIKYKQATIMTIIWVSLSMIMVAFIFFFGHLLHGIENIEQLKKVIIEHNHPIKLDGRTFEELLLVYNKNLALEYFTGYFVEYSLSVDNIFVIMLIMSAFQVERRYYHRLLFWGIIGAVVLRCIFIFLGAQLIQRFDFVLYIFGILLIYTGVKMFIDRKKVSKIDVNNHLLIRLTSKIIPLEKQYHGNAFFIKKSGKYFGTPLFLALVIIEFTDLIFAVDSIPAVFAITKDPYIVFFSNIFAILGLRSLFFLLENVIQKFCYLKIGLAIVLSFVGVKMLLSHQLSELGFTNIHSLLFIIAVVFASILFSIYRPIKKTI